jgi:metal-dependent amidase/aminoacylase/carboxypeptidase family protein
VGGCPALHGHPELAYAEDESAGLLTGELRAGGFDVTEGVAGMPTAFVGRSGDGRKPAVAFLLEYAARSDHHAPERPLSCG